MPEMSETRAFLSSEGFDTSSSDSLPHRPSQTYSVDSHVSGQSDSTIRPPASAPSPSGSPEFDDLKPSAKRSKTSPWWLLPVLTLSAFLYAGTIAPRTELLVKLACNKLHPDWDLVSNSTVSLKNATETNSNSTTHLRLHFVERFEPLGKRSPITTPGTSPMCSDDGAVQREVAKLNTAIATTSGILSVITTGWWTQLSDRVGRTPIIAIGAVSGFMVDSVFVAIVLNSDKFPSGYHLLVFSNMIDGLLGGFSTAVAISHAYVSDCVPPTDRSRWFSLWSGIIFAGMAFGPGVGSLLNNFTKNTMFIFYLGIASDFLFALYVIFILPESMSPDTIRNAAEARRRSKAAAKSAWWKELFFKLLGILSPLTLFFPRAIGRSGGRKRYDWSATFIGIAFSLHSINSGSYTFKYQYAVKAFGWSSTQMGNWLSLLGFTRGIHLTVILPLVLKGIHWYRERNISSRKPLSDEDKAKAVDLLVARASLGVDVSSYTASALVTTSSAFVGTTTLLSLGGGYPPAIQSLALAVTQTSKDPGSNTHAATGEPHYETASTDTSAPDDTGRLLGAMSVVSTLCSQIIGPSIFGMVFVATVETLPRSLFWLSAILNSAALLSLLLVRLSKPDASEDDAEYVLLNNMDE